MKTSILTLAIVGLVSLLSSCASQATSHASHASAGSSTERVYDANNRQFEYKKDGRQVTTPY